MAPAQLDHNSSNCSVSLLSAYSDPLYYRVPLTTLAVLLTLFTVVGNALVVIAVRVNKRLARKRTSILIFNLALADLLVGGGVMPFGISQIINENQWIFGRTLCRIWSSLDVICCTASIFTLCIISVDRFVGVTRPLRYSFIITRGRLWTAVVVVWILSIAVLLTTMQWGDKACRNVYVCQVGEELQYVIHSAIMSFFIPLAVILIVYYKIFRVTRRRESSLLYSSSKDESSVPNAVTPPPRRHFASAGYYNQVINSSLKLRRNTTPNGSTRQRSSLRHLEARNDRRQSSTSTNSGRKFSYQTAVKRPTLRIHYGGSNSEIIKQRQFYSKHKKTAKTLALVVGAFLFCWLPFFVLYLISSACSNECVPPEAMEAFTWLGYSNSALNPIIYAVSMKTFGSGIRQTLDRILSLCSYQQLNGGVTGPGIRGRTRSPSAPNTAIVAECSTSSLGGTSVNGGQCVTVVVRRAKRRLGAIGASIRMSQRGASVGASLRRETQVAETKTQTGACPKPLVTVTNNKLGTGGLDSTDTPATSSDEVISPPQVSDEEPKPREDLMFYVHDSDPNCDEDAELENGVGVAAIRKDISSETGLYMGCYNEELSCANIAHENGLY